MYDYLSTDASKIVVVNEGFFDQPINLRKISKIPNGYDAEELNQITLTGQNPKFTICYLGSFKIRQYVESFFNILKELSQQPEFREKIIVRFIGYVDPFIMEKIQDKNIQFPIEFLGYIEHKKAIQIIAKADLLLAILGRSKSTKAFINSKLFEYIMVKKPILAYGPTDGAAARILQETGCGEMFDYDDKMSSLKYILRIFHSWKNNEKFDKFNFQVIRNYDRRILTKKLAQIFEEV